MQEQINNNEFMSVGTSAKAEIGVGPSNIIPFYRMSRRISAIQIRLNRLVRNLRYIINMVARQNADMANHLNVVRNCQAETARVLNGEIERHALKPAIETVVILADELLRLQQLGIELFIATCPDYTRILDELDISGQIARDKLEYLDIARIAPSRCDTLDHRIHNVVAAETTSDSSLHGSISATISPGMIYRGKVFKPAGVSVFKCEQ